MRDSLALAPTIGAALRLDHIVKERDLTRDERFEIEERAAQYACRGNRSLWDSADVDRAVAAIDRAWSTGARR